MFAINPDQPPTGYKEAEGKLDKVLRGDVATKLSVQIALDSKKSNERALNRHFIEEEEMRAKYEEKNESRITVPRLSMQRLSLAIFGGGEVIGSTSSNQNRYEGENESRITARLSMRRVSFGIFGGGTEDLPVRMNPMTSGDRTGASTQLSLPAKRSSVSIELPRRSSTVGLSTTSAFEAARKERRASRRSSQGLPEAAALHRVSEESAGDRETTGAVEPVRFPFHANSAMLGRPRAKTSGTKKLFDGQFSIDMERHHGLGDSVSDL
jgi:hypothetical protein